MASSKKRGQSAPVETSESIAEQTARRPSQQAWTVRKSRPLSTPSPQRTSEVRKARVTRRFEIEWLQDGEVMSDVLVAPALPAFEQAFGAFTHGVLIQTTEGPVAVEDLYPGMFLECASGRVSELTWKGAITLVPGAPTLSDEPDKLYRVTADAFGLGRPVQDQTFGPHVRRLDRDAKIRAAIGTEAALVPLSGVADGQSVIEVTPVAPTRVYHLACDGHETILAAGLEVPATNIACDIEHSSRHHQCSGDMKRSINIHCSTRQCHRCRSPNRTVRGAICQQYLTFHHPVGCV